MDTLRNEAAPAPSAAAPKGAKEPWVTPTVQLRPIPCAELVGNALVNDGAPSHS